MNFIQRLKEELRDLPGEAAHVEMVPFRKKTSQLMEKAKGYRVSAVMLLLYPVENEWHFILTERPTYNGSHSGQISFPGGKMEDVDADTAATALREMEEEIGVPSSEPELIGKLTEVYIPVSKFLVHPHVGYLDKAPELSLDPREVEMALQVPISSLKDPVFKVVTPIQLPSGVTLKDVPAFRFDEKIVWGATAIMLNEFRHILERI